MNCKLYEIHILTREGWRQWGHLSADCRELALSRVFCQLLGWPTCFAHRLAVCHHRRALMEARKYRPDLPHQIKAIEIGTAPAASGARAAVPSTGAVLPYAGAVL